MRTVRIKTGFHRVGIVLATVCAIPGLASIGSSIFAPERSTTALMAFGVAALFLGGVCYLLARGLGWIVAGFAGDDQISN
jgi:hypothetical protein